MLALIAIADAATEAATTGETTGGIAALGLNGKALLFQLINFLLLLGILRAFAYKPLLKIIRDRRQLMAETITNAADAATARQQAEATHRAVRQQAETEAQQIVAQGNQRAQVLLQQAEAAARQKTVQYTNEATAAIAAEATAAAAELRQQVTTLVATATEIVLKQKVDSAADQQLITEAVATAEIKRSV